MFSNDDPRSVRDCIYGDAGCVSTAVALLLSLSERQISRIFTGRKGFLVVLIRPMLYYCSQLGNFADYLSVTERVWCVIRKTSVLEFTNCVFFLGERMAKRETPFLPGNFALSLITESSNHRPMKM